jgi:hypothetical protein
LGSSHSAYGLNPQYFTLKGFNASNISQSLDYDYEILKKYNNKWDKLKFIIIPIDDFTLFFDLKKSIEPWRVKNYEIYYGIHLSNNIADRTEIFSNKLNVNISRLYHYYVQKNANLTCNKLG